MKTITAQWFECTVAYTKVQDNGLEKKVSENYVVDAMSFTEAEARIIEEVTPFVNGEFEVKKVAKAPYREIAFDDEHDYADKFYKMKVAFITLDEKTGKEKYNNITMLVQADSLRNAIDNLDATMKGSMLDYMSVNAVSTKIVDVFIHKSEKVDDNNRPLDVVLVTPENLKITPISSR